MSDLIFNPKFKISQTVWIAVQPYHLEDPSQLPFIECKVQNIKITGHMDMSDISLKCEYEYLLMAEDSLDSFNHYPESKIYATKQEVVGVSITNMEELIIKAANKLKIYDTTLESLRHLNPI